MSNRENIKAKTVNDAQLLFQNIADVIRQARQSVQQAVNTAIVQCYWQIGHLIVEHEQQGNARAAYGKQQLQQISKQLTAEFGKGFDVRNLRNMRSFYVAYPNRDAVRTELSWTHYRTLLRVENPKARAWYEQEAIGQCWSARALDRQINLHYSQMLPRPCLFLRPHRIPCRSSVCMATVPFLGIRCEQRPGAIITAIHE